MAIGNDTITSAGRLIFELSRDGDTTTRTIDIPYAITNDETIQTAITAANNMYTSSSGQMNTFIQPASWRDDNDTETQWETTRVYYESVTTTTKQITPE